MKKLGIYIHIPFCVQKCLYCDFCSFPKSDELLKKKYVSALCNEMEHISQKCSEHIVDTIYFGGGTPTLLDISLFEQIISSLYRCFKTDNQCEISCECNPATADVEYLASLHSLGVNRLSIGLQSSNERELATLGRIHSYGDFVSTYRDARRAGFENISCDIMYGIPEQTIESFEKTLFDIVSLDAEHISAYGLKIESGTPFGKMRKGLHLPDEDCECKMYMLCGDYLSKHGYDKYEISNFAKRGFESKHNLKYWLGDDYIGFGVSAHSYFEGDRYANSRDIEGYVKGLDITESRRTILGVEKQTEYVMLRMRLRKGVEHSAFEKKFGCRFEDLYGNRLSEYIKNGYVVSGDSNTFFTDKGFLVSNYILSDILDFD